VASSSGHPSGRFLLHPVVDDATDDYVSFQPDSIQPLDAKPGETLDNVSVLGSCDSEDTVAIVVAELVLLIPELLIFPA